jgi:hypothetical protein
MDGRWLAASMMEQVDAAEDVKDLRRELVRVQELLAQAEKRLEQATAHRRRLLSEVPHV